MEAKYAFELREKNICIENLSSDLQKLKKEHLNINYEFEEQLKKHDENAKHQIAIIAAEKDALHKTVSQCTTKVDLFKRKETEFIKQIDELNSIIKSSEAYDQKKEEEIEEIKAKLLQTEDALQISKNTLEEYKQNIELLKNNCIKSEQALKSLQSEKENQEAELNSYKSKCELLLTKCLQHEAAQIKESQANAVMQGKEIALIAQNESLQSEIQRASMQIAFLQSEIQSLKINLHMPPYPNPIAAYPIKVKQNAINTNKPVTPQKIDTEAQCVVEDTKEESSGNKNSNNKERKTPQKAEEKPSDRRKV